MEDEVQKPEPGVKKAWPLFMSWVGSASALIGLFVTLAGGVTWLISHHRQETERQAKMALAEAQENQGEYPAAIQSYGDILKSDSSYRPALDQQLNAAMLWVENFSVLVREDQSATDLAAPALDQILAVLDSGLTRAKGSQAADVQAHLGWAHWLNQHIAEREFGSAAEQNFHAALASDPSNVYANAMLGNWMLQTGGNFNEAIQHFDTAVSTGKARPFVRKLQLGGLIYHETPGARAEMFKAANDMRKGSEQLDEDSKRRILAFCCDPAITDHAQLVESLSAVSGDQAWKTYRWLDDKQGQAPLTGTHLLVRDFIEANLLEISGKREESLQKYRLLQRQLPSQGSTMKKSVAGAIARLSHSQNT
jgi:tetratricopeptide (TPR) repeat protein